MTSIAVQVETATRTSALNTEKNANGQVKRLHHIPRPATKEAERRWLLGQMAAAFRIFAKLGFWINPYAVHFALLKVSDMVRVDEKGKWVDGADKPVNAAGFMIHSAIHKRRPDIHAACHMHSPYGRAWSTFGKGIEMLNQGITPLTISPAQLLVPSMVLGQIYNAFSAKFEITDSCMFYDDLSVYPAFGGVVFAQEEGERIADYLGTKNKNLIMQNHGLLTAGGTVAEAAAFFIALERACQTQLLVEASVAPGSIGHSIGEIKKTFVDNETARYTKEGTGSPGAMYMQFEPEYQLLLKETNGEFLQ